jgi:cytochrome c-type biogenesis protein CcmF
MKTRGENFLKAITNLTLKNKRRYGGYIIHFSIVLIFIGVAGSAFNRETKQQVEIGDTISLDRYNLKITDFKEGNTANYQYGLVEIQAFKDGRLIQTMRPEKRIYHTGEGQATTTIALHSTLLEDLYIVFAGTSNDGRKFELSAYVNPLVFWLWLGAVIMVLGTLITILPDKEES